MALWNDSSCLCITLTYRKQRIRKCNLRICISQWELIRLGNNRVDTFYRVPNPEFLDVLFAESEYGVPWMKKSSMGAGLIDDFICNILFVPFFLYHFGHCILSVPFRPVPFCPRTMLTVLSHLSVISMPPFLAQSMQSVLWYLSVYCWWFNKRFKSIQNLFAAHPHTKTSFKSYFWLLVYTCK